MVFDMLTQDPKMLEITIYGGTSDLGNHAENLQLRQLGD